MREPSRVSKSTGSLEPIPAMTPFMPGAVAYAARAEAPIKPSASSDTHPIADVSLVPIGMDFDYPEFKTENGVAQTPEGPGAWFSDPDGNIFASDANEVALLMQGRLIAGWPTRFESCA